MKEEYAKLGNHVIVPAINTETLNVVDDGFNADITFRENQMSSTRDCDVYNEDKKEARTTCLSDLYSEPLTGAGRYFGRRTVSVNPGR